MTDSQDRGPQFFAVLAHELRSPIGAILGYQELLSEGIFGPLDERALEVAERIRNAALQLLILTDGMAELGRDDATPSLELHPVTLPELLEEAVQRARLEGSGRSASLSTTIARELPAVESDGARLLRCIELLLAAAIKSSPGATMTLAAQPAANGAIIRLRGTALDPHRDVPASADTAATGAALRIAMARRTAAPLAIRLEFVPHDDGTTELVVHVPARVDAARAGG